MNVVSSGGIHAHPAGEPAGRGRLHPANADPLGANHTITAFQITPRSLRSAREPEATLCALRTSAFSAAPREPDAPCLREPRAAPRELERGGRAGAGRWNRPAPAPPLPPARRPRPGRGDP